MKPYIKSELKRLVDDGWIEREEKKFLEERNSDYISIEDVEYGFGSVSPDCKIVNLYPH